MKSLAKPTVVLIETDAMLRKMYARQLSERFHVIEALRAQDALNQMDDAESVDAVVTDVTISQHNGFEFIYELRSYDDWLDVPVILLSSIPERSFESSPDWQRYGIHAFLYKPHTSPRQLMISVSDALAA